ncbi:putative NTF2-like domain superfamily protein [Dioscorea sansibarensis]
MQDVFKSSFTNDNPTLFRVSFFFIYIITSANTPTLHHSVVQRKAGKASSMESGDKYRSHMYGEGEKDTRWRHGRPLGYEVVNKLFEEERTKEWPKGSLEEVVQNTIKTFEMELSHKTNILDFKTINPQKFRVCANGRKEFSGEEFLELGSYNALLKTSMPEKFQYYKAGNETFESSKKIFKSAFPRGFAWEVLSVYSGPPVIVFKFRHWGYMEGPFKGFAPTGELVEFFGVAILKVDESLRAEELEIYYDPAELLAGLLKGDAVANDHGGIDATPAVPQACPFFKGD